MANLICPKCGSNNIDVSLQQENQGNTVVTKTKRISKSGHGCLWWVCIGWWWVFIDSLIWVCAFPVRLCIQLFKKKKIKSSETSVSKNKNKIEYKSVCLCKDCGHNWIK